MGQASLRVAVRKFGPFESAIDKIWQDYRRQSGSRLALDAEALELNPLYDTLLAQEGLKSGAWDVALLNTDWLPEAVDGGALLDLAPLMRARPVPDYPAGWVPSLTSFQHWDDRIYGLPFHDGPECFVYRRDLWESEAERRAFAGRFGYALAPPRSWDEFYDQARFFTRPEHGLYGTVLAAFPDGHNSVYDFCLQLWSRGGDLIDGDGHVTLDSPAAAAALEFIRRICRDRAASYPEPETIDSVRAGELFRQGSVAMMVNWFGFAAVCEQPGSPTRGKVGVAPPPAGVSLSVYWVLAVAAGSRNQEQAYAFVRHAATPAMDKLTTLEGAIGCRLSTWSDSDVNAAVPFYHRLAELTPGARTLPRSRHFPALAHIIDRLVQQALNGDAPADELLRRAQALASGITL